MAWGACIIGPNIGKNGYARVPGGKRGVHLYAHRVAWEQEYGQIPERLHVHHICGTRASVNGEHLKLLTPREHYALNRRCNHEDRYVRPDGRTRCRVCENVAERARYWRKKEVMNGLEL